jgi:hypothetical protein
MDIPNWRMLKCRTFTIILNLYSFIFVYHFATRGPKRQEQQNLLAQFQRILFKGEVPRFTSSKQWDPLRSMGGKGVLSLVMVAGAGPATNLFG